MNTYIEKVKVLTEALPYIKEFYGSTVVIKYGGSAMADDKVKKSVIEDIVLMKLVGMRPVIVHGGGPAINELLNRLGAVPRFVNGIRVTDEETIEVVKMVLCGIINKDIVRLLQNQGISAAGISGIDGNMLQSARMTVNDEDVGLVGEIEKVDTRLIESLIDKDFIPVIAPIGEDKAGICYNINADYAAAAVAGALKARKLVFLTDVEGILRDKNDKSSVISEMFVDDIDKMIDDGTISGGMIPKITCCREAIDKGVGNVHILDGRVEHCLLLEVFTRRGIGTMIKERYL